MFLNQLTELSQFSGKRQKSCESIADVDRAQTPPSADQLKCRRSALTANSAHSNLDVEAEPSQRTSTPLRWSASADSRSIVIVPRNASQDKSRQSRNFNRAFTNQALQTFMDMQKACEAAKNFYAAEEGKQKNVKVFKKLLEWSHRAKAIEMIRHVEDALKKTSDDFQDEPMQAYLGFTCEQMYGPGWDLLPEDEQKRLRSVWELFCGELDFLYNRLLVLRNVFKEPLKQCQVEGYLMSVEPGLLFGNLEELCEVSYNFCKNFLDLILWSKRENCFGCTQVILTLFDNFANHLSPIAAYQAYCINYKTMLDYLDAMRKTDDRFIEFEKATTRDSRCGKLQLQDLLIAPLHRITRLPLLVKRLQKYTADPGDKNRLGSIIEYITESLKNTDESIQWLRNFERLQELQAQLIWPSIGEMDPKVYVPEFLKLAVSKQFCEKLLAHPKRRLIHEGLLLLCDIQHKMDIYAFLFNDMLLVTRQKGERMRKPSATKRRQASHKYTVINQPVPLDCCVFCDVTDEDAGNCGLKHAFVILHLTRFCQVTGVYTLQAPTNEAKNCWITKFQQSIESYESIQLKDMLNYTSINNLPQRSLCNSARNSPPPENDDISVASMHLSPNPTYRRRKTASGSGD